jgi:ComF family protein
MQLSVKYYLNAFNHLLFPHCCAICGADYIHLHDFLCVKCIHQLPLTRFLNLPDNPVEKIFAGRIKVNAAGAPYYFTKQSMMQHLLVLLKYKNSKASGLFLGNQLGQALSIADRFQSVDYIIPLPLHPKKEYIRGYNQAAIIGEGIQQVWNKPLLKNSIIRLINTSTQTHENRSTRWQNMEGIFHVTQPEILRDKHILLVDDVVTTGASLEACGAAILKIPGTTLSIASVAYTI